MGHGISPDFIEELQTGRLSPILQLVQQDHTLSLFIRENQINIYYRGGSLLEIKDNKNGEFILTFNDQYLEHLPTTLPKGIHEPRTANLRPTEGGLEDEVAEWMGQIPGIKLLMDRWFSKHQWREREFEQMMDRVNNSISDTDYFICDMEYTNSSCKQLRADLIAIKWESNGQIRRSLAKASLAFIEVKYMDGAVNSGKGKSGLVKHVTDLADVLDPTKMNGIKIDNLAKEMTDVFKQRYRLGLIPALPPDRNSMQNDGDVIDTAHLEYILVMAEHDPKKRGFKDELCALNKKQNSPGKLWPFEIKVAQANYFGHGLYKYGMIPLNQFLLRCKQGTSSSIKN